MNRQNDWTRVDERLPLEGEKVETISPGGMHQTLVRQGPLWYFTDYTMYVYYTPEFWRKLDD